MRRLNQEKGFLLISALIFLIFLSILAIAIFYQSISENNFIKISVDELRAKYNAQYGLECASYEVMVGGAMWVTHTAPAAGPPWTLSDADNPHPALAGCSINSNGNYTCSGLFEAKIYQDPNPLQPGRVIILSRGISGSQAYLLASKISTTSLYENFRFTPYELWLQWATYLAQGGNMHANGNIIINEKADMQNIGELSTPNYIFYGVGATLPTPQNCTIGVGACNWESNFIKFRKPWSSPNLLTDPETLQVYENYYNQSENHVSGERRGLYMENDPSVPYDESNPSTYKYIPCTDTTKCILPHDDLTYEFISPRSESLIYTDEQYIRQGVPSGMLIDLAAKIQPCTEKPCTDPMDTIQIPTRLNKEYSWNKLSPLWPLPTPEGGMWSLPVTTDTNVLSTEKQPVAWRAWLDDNPILKGIIKEHNTEGKTITAPEINDATYFDNAKTNGVYIYVPQDQTTPVIRIGGEEVLPCTLQSGGGGACDPTDPECIELPPMPTKDCPAEGAYMYKPSGGSKQTIGQLDYLIDSNSTLRNDVVRLNIKNLGTATGNRVNGIIFAEYNVALENANTLPSQWGGLTTVGKENVYLVGNYNAASSATYQPSAVITAKYVYTLSNNFSFKNYHELRDTIHNPNYPYTSASTPPNTTYDEAAWQIAHQADMPTLVNSDTTYNVSLVGFQATYPQVLERWWDAAGQNHKRTIVGSFVTLKNDNFKWKEFSTDGGQVRWPAFDLDLARLCSRGFAGECRGESFPSWPSGMGSEGPSGAYNEFRYETRYNVAVPSTLPPGGLPGFSVSLMIELEDTPDNFNTHCTLLN